MTWKLVLSCKNVIAAGLNKIINGQRDTENWILYPKNEITPRS